MKIFLIFLSIAVVGGIELGCDFNYDYNWTVIGQVYTCQVTSMNFTGNSTHVTGVSGSHLSGNSSADVGMVFFPWNMCPHFYLTAIPKNLLNFFPNLIAFYFNTCSIKFLTGDELDEYPNTQSFVLVASALERVPGNFFASTPDMKYVDFGHNKIKRVGENLLDNLQILQRAYFTSNICIDIRAPNRLELPALIEALRSQCPDIESETTTGLTTTSTSSTSTTSSTTTTNQPPRCEIENLEDFVCGIDEENERLRNQVGNLEGQIVNLAESNVNLNGQVETQGEQLETHENLIENLKAETQELRAQMLKMDQALHSCKCY